MPLQGRGPVRWVLGHDFVRTLKGLILYSLFPDRLDPRDWMRPEAVDLSTPPGTCHTGVDPTGNPTPQEFWFDYLADTGDSQRAAYSVAYALHGDLAAVGAHSQLDADAPVLATPLSVRFEPHEGDYCLPRGAFLLIGGDTAYPVSNLQMLQLRLIAPFDYAFDKRFECSPPPPPRYLFAIPGNHDWYDSLDGFNRLFRRPGGNGQAPLAMKGFKANQEASYVALNLPFGWQLWGLDAPAGDMDKRQQLFFAQHARQHPPQRLILATPEPTYVYGDLQAETQTALRTLPLDLVPPRHAVRLDLSGDVHHYERYGHLHTSRKPEPDTWRYASVVSGLGGAFLHPSHVQLGTTKPDRVFPEPDVSRDQTYERLTRPFLMLGSWTLVWLVFLLGLLLGAGTAALLHETSRFATLVTTPLGVPALARLIRQAVQLDPLHAVATGRGFPLLACVVFYSAFLVIWFAILRRFVSQDEHHARAHVSPVVRGTLGLVPLLALPAVLGVFSLLVHTRDSFLMVVGGFTFYVLVVLLLAGMAVFAVVGSEGKRPLWKNALMALLGLVTGYLLAAVVMGGVQLALPLVDAILTRLGGPLSPPPTVDIVDWGYVLRALIGGLVGGAVALLLPWLFGLYILAQQALFNGHATIAGALTRIDSFQTFIRFRLRRHADGHSTLTGFVFAIEAVDNDALTSAAPKPETLVPKTTLIDVFSLDAPPVSST